MVKKRINLLPPGDQNQNRFSDINFQIVRLGSIVTATVLILILGLFVAQLFFENTLSQTEVEIEINKQILAHYQKAGLENEILELNETMSNFNSLLSSQPKWSPYLIELARILPTDVSIDSLKINAATRKVEAAGTSLTRDSVLQLRENILRSRYFENINFPLVNLEKPNNVSWKFRFYLKAHAP